jgi:hypothetical protein
MDWSTFLSPQVIAPTAGLVGVLVGAGISSWTAKSTHKERLAADREQAERRIAAELALAEKKVSLDRALAGWKRRVELAEEALSEFYQAREIIMLARHPASFEGEGRTRTRAGHETEEDSKALDSYYVTIERMSEHKELFSRLYAKRYRFQALFGRDAVKPFDDLFRIRDEVAIAVRMLMRTYRSNPALPLPAAHDRWEATMGWGTSEDDPIAKRLDQAVEDIERICQPAIQIGAS